MAAERKPSLRWWAASGLVFPCLPRPQVILPVLKQNFKRDEFIGRIKEILFFLPFTEEQLRALARGELQKWKTTAYDRHKIVLEWDRDVEDLLCKVLQQIMIIYIFNCTFCFCIESI